MNQPVKAFSNPSRESNVQRTIIEDDVGLRSIDSSSHDDDDAVDESRYHTNDHDEPPSNETSTKVRSNELLCDSTSRKCSNDSVADDPTEIDGDVSAPAVADPVS